MHSETMPGYIPPEAIKPKTDQDETEEATMAGIPPRMEQEAVREIKDTRKQEKEAVVEAQDNEDKTPVTPLEAPGKTEYKPAAYMSDEEKSKIEEQLDFAGKRWSIAKPGSEKHEAVTNMDEKMMIERKIAQRIKIARDLVKNYFKNESVASVRAANVLSYLISEKGFNLADVRKINLDAELDNLKKISKDEAFKQIVQRELKAEPDTAGTVHLATRPSFAIETGIGSELLGEPGTEAIDITEDEELKDITEQDLEDRVWKRLDAIVKKSDENARRQEEFAKAMEDIRNMGAEISEDNVQKMERLIQENERIIQTNEAIKDMLAQLEEAEDDENGEPTAKAA